VTAIPDGFLTTWCETLAEGTEMPPEAYLTSGLVCVSAIVGPRMRLHWSHTHKERCNLWVVNVGRSALARKTSGMSAAKWAMGIAEGVLNDQVRWYAIQRFSDAQIARDLDVVGPDTKDARDAAAKEAKESGEDPEYVAPVRRKVPVGWLMSLNEVSSLWGDNLRDYQQAAQQFLLEVFDGALSSNTTATFVPGQETFVSAIGNIPPSEMSDRTTLAMLRSGFAGRWIVMPTPAPVRPIHIPRLGSREKLESLAGLVVSLAELAEKVSEVDVFRSMWPEGGEADKCRESWYGSAWKRLKDSDAMIPEEQARAELFGRLQSTSVKLSSIVAITRAVGTVGTLNEVVVSGDDCHYGQQLVDDSLSYLMQIVEDSGAASSTPVGKMEGRVLRFLERRNASSEESAISLASVSDGCKGKTDRETVRRAVESLASSGKVGCSSPGALTGGVRNVHIWLVS
jgi:hypothetical protein